MLYAIRRLEPDDNRKTFTCGDDNLDRFFRRYAGQSQFRHHVGTTYIAVKDEVILGFVTVCATQIEVEELPEGERSAFLILYQLYVWPVWELRRRHKDKKLDWPC